MKIGLIGIVGEAMKADFWGTAEKVAGIGYAGLEAVEGFLTTGDTAANVARFRTTGLELLTTSASREDLRDRFDAVRETALAVGAPRVSVWWSPADTRDGLMRDCDLYNEAGAKLIADGIKLCYHNHDQEFKNTFDGVYALDILAMHTDPASVFFTLDVGWVGVGGEDPVRVLKKLNGRVPAIHLKDFADFADRASFTTLGTGLLDLPAIMAAAREAGVQWGVVEQDRLRHLSAFDTIATSFYNLKERGLT